MKLKRLGTISIPQSVALSILVTIFMVSANSVMAQNAKPATASDLKVFSFGIERKTSTQLDVIPIPTNNNLRPTEVHAYRSEIGAAPKAGDEYGRYERRQTVTLYAVLRVTNASAKTIKSIDWEYTNPHFKGDQVIVYRKISSRKKIASGQNATLSKKIADEYPCHTSLGSMFGNQSLRQSCRRKTRQMTPIYPVEVKLLQIKYEDGTVWKARP